MEFSKKTRELSIKKMQERTLDLLVIGGGITGAGVALQAAASGLDTGLIEMQDFAEGTSSRSNKIGPRRSTLSQTIRRGSGIRYSF